MEKPAVQLRRGDVITIYGRTETVVTVELSPADGCFVTTDARSDAYVLDSFKRIPVADR